MPLITALKVDSAETMLPDLAESRAYSLSDRILRLLISREALDVENRHDGLYMSICWKSCFVLWGANIEGLWVTASVRAMRRRDFVSGRR